MVSAWKTVEIATRACGYSQANTHTFPLVFRPSTYWPSESSESSYGETTNLTSNTRGRITSSTTADSQKCVVLVRGGTRTKHRSWINATTPSEASRIVFGIN